MSTTTTQLSLGDFIASHAIDGSVAGLGMRLAWPILQTARLGRYVRGSRSANFEPGTFIDAVRTAVGKTPTRVSTVWRRDIFSAEDRETRYGVRVDFNDSLAIALYNARWPALKDRLIAAFGYDRYLDVHEGLWACIRREVAQPLGFQFWDNAFDGAISSAGESLATGLYYLLSQAVVGDDEAVEAVGPLVRLLPLWIPIGQIRNEPGHWLAAASSV